MMLKESKKKERNGNGVADFSSHDCMYSEYAAGLLFFAKHV